MLETIFTNVMWICLTIFIIAGTILAVLFTLSIAHECIKEFFTRGGKK